MADDKSTDGVTRRTFIDDSVKTAAALAVGAGIAGSANAAQDIPRRRLGKTDVEVSALCLGGWHIGAIPDEQEAIRVMHAAVDEGLTFFDNSWDYHDGRSEVRMGKALAADGKRDQVFLMTKGCNRDYDGATKCIDESLQRLQTDYLDLWQFHEIIYENDPDWVFERGGIEAALDAQKAGKIRFIGFTGHRDPRVHKKMLEKPYAWDTVQMPINMMDAHFRSFRNEIVPMCQAIDAGVIGMKSLGGGVLPTRAGIGADTCIRYALSQPVATIVVGMLSMDDLTKNVATARNYTAMPDAEQDALRATVKEVAGDGRYELYKTTMRMDGPYHAKQHGFEVA